MRPRNPYPRGPMPRFLLAAVVAAVAVAAARPQPAAAPPRYAVEAKDVKRVRAVLTYTVTCPDLKATEWQVVAAAAPELPGQAKTKTTLEPAGKAVVEPGPAARGLLMGKVTANTAELKTTLPIRVTYEATLRSRTLVPLRAGAAAPKVEPLSAADRARYLADAGDIDFKTEAFQSWLKAAGLVRGAEDDIAFARAALAHLRDHMTYNYTPGQDRKASAVCGAGRSDCGGLSVLYAAVLRANGIPARTLYGRWALSADQAAALNGVAYYQWHVKAEFFAAGVGWVPADPAGAVQYDKTPDLRHHFGADPGDFLAFHVDPNLAVDAAPFGRRTLGNLQTPAWWVQGGGSATPNRAVEGWTVERP